jgi:hypothetical protein
MIRTALRDLVYKQASMFKSNPQITNGDIEILAPGVVGDYQNAHTANGKISLSGVTVKIRIPFIEVDI